MSKFFKALEQAERERALRQGGAQAPGTAEAAPPELSESAGQTTPAGQIPPAGQTSGDAPPPKRAKARWRTPAPAPVPERAPDVQADLSREVEDHLVSLLTPSTFAAEQYRSLCYLVEQARRSAGLKVIGITSPAVGDGKTTTAINLAGSLGHTSDARILLVDGDLRAASVAKHLGIEDREGPGLVDAILDPSLPFESLVRPCPPYNFSVVTAGRSSEAPYELLKSSRLGEILDEARRRYDYVILDTAPLVAVPDCRVIGEWVDGFVVVVMAHKTPRKLLEEALNLMDPNKVVGLVFNGDDRPLSGYYKSAHGLGYGNAYGAAYGGQQQAGKPRRWRRMMNRIRSEHRPPQGGR
jgi:capsular exopolysaccharide synthesis family protein